MIHIIHFADTHIGVDTIGPIDPETHINGRVMDCLDMIDAIVDFARAEQVDLILFAGDAFHINTPNPLYMAEFSKRIMAMAQICPVVLLVGNHDNFRHGSSLSVYEALDLGNVMIGSDYDVYEVQTKNGNIQVATAPWPSYYNRQGGNSLSDKLAKISKRVDDSCPAVLLGHFSVGGAQYGSERGYIAGTEANIPLDLLVNGPWQYVALGHIHYHQCIFDDPPIVYAGSIERVTHGEEHEDKGFVLITIDDNKTSWEFIQLDARPYKTIEVTVGGHHQTDAVLKRIAKVDLDRAVVRVIIHIDESMVASINKSAIMDAIMDAGAYCISSFSIMAIRSNAARYDAAEFNVTMTPIELLGKYFEDEEPKKRKALLALAREIMETNDSSN